jgi:hypothetical protein
MEELNKTDAMFDLVNQWQQSGISQKEFCALNGIKVATLGYWIKKYKQKQTGYEGFASLSLGQEPMNHSGDPKIEIELAGGLVVRIY